MKNIIRVLLTIGFVLGMAGTAIAMPLDLFGNATISEPMRMILFGIGILGIAEINRKKIRESRK